MSNPLSTKKFSGINQEIGLKNTAYNKALYYRLLKIFKQRLDQDAPVLEKLLLKECSSRKGIQQAYEIVHNFKGISMNLGAENLAGISTRLCDILEEYEDGNTASLYNEYLEFNQCVKVLQFSLSKIE